jgi:hypothetical protein
VPQSSQIARPAVVLDARNNVVFRVKPVTLRPGRDLSDWDSFKLTLREDPDWADRRGPAGWVHAPDDLDPYYDSWPLALQITLAAADAIVEETVGLVVVKFLEFPVPAADIDLPGGFERYAADVRAYSDDDDPGEATLVRARFVTLKPRTG